MKKSTYEEIQEAIPDLKNEKISTYSDELDRILSLKKLFSSKDGKELIKVLRDNCSSTLNRLVVVAKENPTLPLLLTHIFRYSENINLLAQLQDIKAEDEIRDQLDEAVKEATS